MVFGSENWNLVLFSVHVFHRNMFHFKICSADIYRTMKLISNVHSQILMSNFK